MCLRVNESNVHIFIHSMPTPDKNLLQVLIITPKSEQNYLSPRQDFSKNPFPLTLYLKETLLIMRIFTYFVSLIYLAKIKKERNSNIWSCLNIKVI